MSRRPRVLLDVDGPLTRGYVKRACEHLRDLGRADAYPAAVRAWDVMASLGASRAERAAVSARMKLPGVAAGFEPRAGAREFVDGLRAWADVYACTAPLAGSLTWGGEREAWLRLHFDIPHDRIVQAQDKHLVAGDALVDDKVENLVAWRDEWPARLAALWSETYNAGEIWRGPRVATYAELTALLEGRLR